MLSYRHGAMPIEMELKLQVPSHQAVRDRLRELNASCAFAVLETNTILDHADEWLRRGGCGLRVRTMRDEKDAAHCATLTFKGPRQPGPLKTREEIEVEINDPAGCLKLLERLGYGVILRYQKRRERWICGHCRVELDTPPHIGTFVEIEGPDEATIRETRRLLGLDEAEEISQSYVAMLSDYCHQHDIKDRTLYIK